MSLLRKEREMGITPDPAVDAYLKANSLNALLPAGQLYSKSALCIVAGD